MPHIHSVDRGTGIPKDRDEVNRREVYECDGWVCDLDLMDTPSKLSVIRTDVFFSNWNFLQPQVASDFSTITGIWDPMEEEKKVCQRLVDQVSSLRWDLIYPSQLMGLKKRIHLGTSSSWDECSLNSSVRHETVNISLRSLKDCRWLSICWVNRSFLRNINGDDDHEDDSRRSSLGNHNSWRSWGKESREDTKIWGTRSLESSLDRPISLTSCCLWKIEKTRGVDKSYEGGQQECVYYESIERKLKTKYMCQHARNPQVVYYESMKRKLI